MPALVRLGLTGGIGSGKSTVAGLLAASGAAVVDADAIAHELTAAGGLALAPIAAAFGNNVISPTGALERDKMRALIHTNADARHLLESIIHPLVAQQTQTLASAYADAGRTCIVFDVPLLVESASWRQRVDDVLVVDCTPEVQINRVMARSHLTRAEVEKIIASQADRPRRLAAADTVIFNNALSLAELADEVHQIACHFGLSSTQQLAY